MGEVVDAEEHRRHHAAVAQQCGDAASDNNPADDHLGDRHGKHLREHVHHNDGVGRHRLLQDVESESEDATDGTHHRLGVSKES
ncbi:hypothetical protein BG842_07305 [Haladaptatus sp. W1]|uniref:hypothetical protein n=1 Tax=Haladaptatus sp. W1 TaxID=1897478 RepID=UPI000849A16C|nr:hypothetical protein [Haladaptatus sp. W1]ODR79192.1 hypothetical protein BG842_07305 [Haladaptatus sp. W1]